MSRRPLLLTGIALLSATMAADARPEIVAPTTTPWPGLLPCQRFARAELLVSRDAELAWRDGSPVGAAETRHYTLRHDDEFLAPLVLPLDLAFPAGRLDHLDVQPRSPRGGPLSVGIRLRCEDGRAGVAWGQDAHDGLEAVFAAPVQRWSDAPEAGAAALGAAGIAGRTAEVRILVAAAVARLSEGLAFACAGRPCSREAWEATLAAARAATAPLGLRAVETSADGWTARAAGAGLVLELGCVRGPWREADAGPECELRLFEGGRLLVQHGRSLQCAAEGAPAECRTRLWFALGPRGGVEIESTPESGAVVRLHGGALQTRPVSRAGARTRPRRRMVLR